ncbi:MAG: hypothetical protein KBD94_03445, partial [Pyrinomonadaceae bacterium]|nr:hypothetical protein [Pyrinomonadaceae bacterium]
NLVAGGIKLVVNQRRDGDVTIEIIKCGRASRQTDGASIRNEIVACLRVVRHGLKNRLKL